MPAHDPVPADAPVPADGLPPASEQAPPRVVLLGKPGCHLCDVAGAVVAQVCGELGVGWVERSILDDPELERRHRDQIPVVLVDGVQHGHWRVDADRLRAALVARAR